MLGADVKPRPFTLVSRVHNVSSPTKYYTECFLKREERVFHSARIQFMKQGLFHRISTFLTGPTVFPNERRLQHRARFVTGVWSDGTVTLAS